MIFDVEYLKTNAPSDPNEGRICVEPVKGKVLDNLYNMTIQMDDYVNTTTDVVLSWRIISSCASYLEKYLENWKQRLMKYGK
jgi:hypothetical protein